MKPKALPPEQVPLYNGSDTGLWRLLEEMRLRERRGDDLHTEAEAKWWMERFCVLRRATLSYWLSRWSTKKSEASEEDARWIRHAIGDAKAFAYTEHMRLRDWEKALNHDRIAKADPLIRDNEAARYLVCVANGHCTDACRKRENAKKRETPLDGDETMPPAPLEISRALTSESKLYADQFVANLEAMNASRDKRSLCRMKVFKEFWLWQQSPPRNGVNVEAYCRRHIPTIDDNSVKNAVNAINDVLVEFQKSCDPPLTLVPTVGMFAELQERFVEHGRNFWGRHPLI